MIIGDFIGDDWRRVPREINKKAAIIFSLRLLFHKIPKNEKNQEKLSEITEEIAARQEEINRWLKQRQKPGEKLA